jgi:hypothetical protein
MDAAQMDEAVRSTGNGAVIASSRNLFAIIGQVARPGVYQAPLSEPFLVDLLQNAGGFSDEASGYLRIIRHGPRGVEAIYASGSDFQLGRGDVIVAVRKSKLAIAPRAVRQSSASMNDVAGIEQPSTHVQLAFVNLTNRPIVLRMRRENATVGRILELLGHSPNLAQTVRVIAPDKTTNFTPPSQQLVSESVLVFDPAVIRQDRLPELPTRIVNDMHATIAADSSGATSENRDAAQQPFDLAIADNLPSSDALPLDTDSSKLLEDANPQSAQNGLSIPPVRTAELLPPTRIQKLPPELLLMDDPLAPPDVSEAKTGGRSWGSVLMYSLLTISICIASGWGVLHLLRRRMQSLQTASPVKSIDDEHPVNLDEIIYDQLPVVEESLARSESRSVFSQSASKTHTRIDETHAVRRPHFLPDTAIPDTMVPNESQPAQEDVVSAEDAPKSGGKQFRFDAKHDRDTVRKPVTAANHAAAKEPQGLLDRVLSRVQGTENR